MSITPYSEFTNDFLRWSYWLDGDSGKMEFRLSPVNVHTAPPERIDDALAQVAVRGDAGNDGFAAGLSMRDSGTLERFRFAGQSADGNRVTTIMRDDRGLELRHIVGFQSDTPFLEIHTELANHGSLPVTIDLLESFALGGLPPADGETAVHRFRSNWSSEARPVRENAADLALECSWSAHSRNTIRFGQVGSMPVRGYHPFCAIEDVPNKIFYGAVFAWAGSWQMMLGCRRPPCLTLSGGLGDREFAHWSKQLAPGETLTAPAAYLAASHGSLDDLCAALVEAQERRLDLPASEEDLPIIFNEWCTTWGHPSAENIRKIAARLTGTPIRYFVIDAGWYKPADAEWNQAQGDWLPNRDMFPDGLAPVAAELRRYGFIPGLWAEMEVAGPVSRAYREMSDHQLKLDGIPIDHTRHFWDLNDPVAIAHLEKHLVALLRDNGFGYVKIDYNETIGFGCDHPDSPGEGLRRQTLGTYAMFRRLRESNPDLVIENCASGGHRLEPSMFALSSMSSFSDAHEEPEIPVIAASLHRLMLPRQCQIWAVVKPAYCDRKMCYILSSAMLGRFCLSGDVLHLSDAQWARVREAMDFYRRIAPVLKHGRSVVSQHLGPARRNLRGYQSLVRTAPDGKTCLLIVHGFHETPAKIAGNLPPGNWRVTDMFPADARQLSVAGNRWHICGMEPFSGIAARLENAD